MTTKKDAPKKAAPKRVEIFAKKYFDKSGIMHNVGDVCTLTDDEELTILTERDALKTVVNKAV